MTVRPAFAQNRITSSVGVVARQVDVGEHERLLVAAAGEADARLLAHGAVHAVGADDVARADGVAVGERGGDAVGVLRDGGQHLGPKSRRRRARAPARAAAARCRSGGASACTGTPVGSALKSIGISTRSPSRMVNSGAWMPSLTRRRETSRPSSTSSVRALTAAAREVLAPSACRSTSVTSHAAGQQRCGQRQAGRAGSHDEDVGVVHAGVSFVSKFCQRLLAFPWCAAFAEKSTLVGLHLLAWASKADQTKAVILAAARERFAESGYEAATIRAIAADANIDPSMVMRYFGNKDQLFAAAAEFDLRFPDLSDVPPSELGHGVGVALPRRAGRRTTRSSCCCGRPPRMPKRRNA